MAASLTCRVLKKDQICDAKRTARRRRRQRAAREAVIMLRPWVQQTYSGYSEKELALGRFFVVADCIGILTFALFYLAAAFSLARNAPSHAVLDFSPPGFVYIATLAFAFVTSLVIYQHCAVAPYPTEDTVDHWMVHMHASHTSRTSRTSRTHHVTSQHIASHFFSKVMQKIGRWVFLTRQTLCIQAIHAVASVTALLSGSRGLASATHAVAVLVAGLGIFVTCQYFMLVHTHADYVHTRETWAKRGIPFTEMMVWLHTPCGVFGVLDVMIIKQRDVLLELTPSYLTLCTCYAVFILGYLILVRANYAMTKHWPYALMKALGTSMVKWPWVKFTVGQIVIVLAFMTCALLLATYTRPIW